MVGPKPRPSSGKPAPSADAQTGPHGQATAGSRHLVPAVLSNFGQPRCGKQRTSWYFDSEAADTGRQRPRAPYILVSMQRKAIMTRIVWTMCVWLLVTACAVAWTSVAWADHARIAAAESGPFYGVLRFLAPEPAPQHHKKTRAARAGRTAKFADLRMAATRTRRTRRSRVLAKAGLHRVRRLRVVRAVIAPFYPQPPYPPVFVPRYPGPPFAYAGAPPFAGYDFRYSPGSYGYRYEYPYPYYVYYGAPWYYVVPWPPRPAGY